MGSRSSSMYAAHPHSSKRRHYSTLLLLALGAAMLSVLVLHKLREGRVVGLLLQERERQLLTLQLILEKERAHSKEMKTKIEELKEKAVSLRTQKIHLNNRLLEAENQAAYLKGKRQELESALQEQQDQLATLKDMEEASTKANQKVAALEDLLKQLQDHDCAPANATLLDETSNGNETQESTRKESSEGDRDDDGDTQSSNGVKKVDRSEQEQSFKKGHWVRFQTNTADGDSTGAEDRGMEEVSEEGKLLEDGISQVGNQSAVQIRYENQVSKTELLLNSTVDGDVPVMKDEVTSSNTTESNVRASEDGQLGKKETVDEEEKQTATESNVRASEDGQPAKKDTSDDGEVMKGTSGDSEVKQTTRESNVRASEDGQLEKDTSDDGEVMKGTSRNSEVKQTTTESNVRASEDGQLEKDTSDGGEVMKGTSSDGEVKQTTTESNVKASEDGQLEKDTSDGGEVMKDTSGDGEVKQTTTESNVKASEDAQQEKDTSDGGEEKQTRDSTETNNKRSRRRRTKGRRSRRAAVRSWGQNTKASTDSQAGISQHEESSKVRDPDEYQVINRNATEVSSAEVQSKQSGDQTASEEAGVTEQKTQTDTASEGAEVPEQKTQTDIATEGAEVAEQKTETDTVSLATSAGSHSDVDSEAKGTESYQDTNGIQETSGGGDDKNGSDSGDEMGTIRSINESNMTEGARHDDGVVEIRQENNVRSTMEVDGDTTASNEGIQTGDFRDGGEGGSTGKETGGAEQSRERDEDDDEEKVADVSIDSVQQEGASETAEDGEVSEESRPEQEPETGNSTEASSREENEAEEAVGEAAEAERDEERKEDEEF